MGGFFGTISKRECVLDIFFGVDYHNFAVLEVFSADPGTDDRSLSAVQETGEKINQTIIHK